MGFLEFVVEIILEGVIKLIGLFYIKVMQLVVPNKTVSKKAKRIIKYIATTVAVLLSVALIIGLILLMQDDPFIKNIGKYMTYIPLILMVLQITVGIMLKIVEHFKK